jgi:autophagy-related protein 13
MHTGSTSPPVTGAMSREHLPLGSSPNPPLTSPTSLSFSKQPLPRTASTASGRQPSYTGSSPFIPSSLERERDNSMPPPSSTGQQSLPKKYSTSLGTSQGQRRVSSYGSSAGGDSLHGQSQNLLRRSSTRMSTESGLRHSLEKDTQQVNVPDNDDIQSFLKTLEALPQPPSLAIQASRARLPSASSSLSNTSIPQASPSNQSNVLPGRTPVTRAQVDDAVKRMTGSFAITTKALEGSSIMPKSVSPGSGSGLTPATATATSTSRTSSVGLLSASRPSTTAPRRVSPASLAHGQGDPVIPGSGSVKRNSPLSGAPFQPPPTRVVQADNRAAQTALPPSPPPAPPATRSTSKSAARSLPAGPGLVDDPSNAGHPTSGFLSPQPTGSRTSSQRRGPVLLRGGFEGRSQSTIGTGTGTGQRLSTSPSRSPIRDYSRLATGAVSGFVLPSNTAVGGSEESRAEAELTGWRYRSEQRIKLRSEGNQVRNEESSGRRQSIGAANVLDSDKGSQAGQGQGQGQQTAPSSLGRGRERDLDSPEGD